MPIEIVLTAPKLTGIDNWIGTVKPSISLSIVSKKGGLSRYSGQFDAPTPFAAPDVGPPQLMVEADIGDSIPGTNA